MPMIISYYSDSTFQFTKHFYIYYPISSLHYDHTRIKAGITNYHNVLPCGSETEIPSQHCAPRGPYQSASVGQGTGPSATHAIARGAAIHCLISTTSDLQAGCSLLVKVPQSSGERGGGEAQGD